MGDSINLSEARWARESDPTKHPPRSALEALLRDIESGEANPKHIVIAVAVKGAEGCRTRYYQAGELDFHGQLGLVTRVAQMMGGDD